MESFRYSGVSKLERAKKSEKSIFHLRKMPAFFRVMELLVILLVVSRFSFQLWEAVKSSGEYFKDLKLAVLSSRFIFVLGNVIVITLFAKSGRFSGKSSERKNDFYDEFVQKSERLSHSPRLLVESDNRKKEDIFDKAVTSIDVDVDSCCSGMSRTAAYRRSLSEKLIHEQVEKPNRELRRSATEKCVKRFSCGEKLSIEGPFPEDSMSNDEFRQTVEAFIARQQSFLRDEECYALNVPWK